MGFFGERLKREREMRGINLDEIAEATKIGTRSLRALEEEDFEKLPGGIFNKGFVRSYARYLGIDEEEAVADYLIAIGETPAKAKQPTPEVVAQQRAAAAKAKPVDQPSEAAADSTSSSWWPGLGALILIVALGAGVWQFYFREGLAQPRPAPVAPAPQGSFTPVPPPQPAPASLSTSTAAPSAAEAQVSATATAPGLPAAPEQVTRKPAASEAKAAVSDGFTLQVRARQKSWVRITADGRIVVDEELAPAAERSVHASREIVLRTGNAGGVEISHNGKPIPALGSEHEVRTVTFNSEGPQ